MAIVQREETYGEDVFRYTYSDANCLIRQDQTGHLYTDALDIPDSGYTYTETDMPIPADDNVYEEAGKILLGEEE